MLITDEFEWDFPTFEAHVEGMCTQVVAHPSNVIAFHATLTPLTVLTLFATWKVGKIAFPLRTPDQFTPTWPTPQTPTSTKWDLDNLATYLYTSGSSGKPKIACHTLRNHVLSAQGSGLKIPLTEKSCWNLALPLYHVGGLGILFRCYLSKAKVLLSKNLSKATHLSLVPTQLFRLQREGIKLTQTILLGGAPLPKTSENILPTYGMTEMSSQIVTAHTLHPHAEMKISPEGEIWVRGGTLFQGYINAISHLNTEGWFETGDLGMWKEGRFEIIGRKDNLFISGGENIQPEEVEAAIRDHCNIFDAIVVPLKDEEFGARPVVFLSDPSLLRAIQFRLLPHLPKFKIPIQAFLLQENKGLKHNRLLLKKLANKEK
jgi:o-succinylbenzoate---CoA ligase